MAPPVWKDGQEKISYQGKGEEPIRIHEHIRFQIISTGPTPVSDVAVTGLEAFVMGLQAQGYQPEIIDAANRRLLFAYEVETGIHKDKIYKLGLDVP